MKRPSTLLLSAMLMVSVSCGGGARARTPAPVDDGTLAVRVRTSLANAPVVHAKEILVEVSQGVVVLKGEVHGESEITAAIAAANMVSGIREVKSELKPTLK